MPGQEQICHDQSAPIAWEQVAQAALGPHEIVWIRSYTNDPTLGLCTPSERPRLEQVDVGNLICSAHN